MSVWIVYGVLRFAADNVDFASMTDHAGAMTEAPTIFDLAEHQRITAYNVSGWTIGRLEPRQNG